MDYTKQLFLSIKFLCVTLFVTLIRLQLLYCGQLQIVTTSKITKRYKKRF
jgi:hypothetical protein